MAYIYKKTIGSKEYYYLRASGRKDGKIVIKDIKYLGSNLDSVKESLKNIPSKYVGEIRKTYKTIYCNDAIKDPATKGRRRKRLKSIRGCEAIRCHHKKPRNPRTPPEIRIFA